MAVFSRGNNNRPQNRAQRRAASQRSNVTPITSLTSYSNSTSPDPVAYSYPRSLTAAAVQININDKGEAERFRQRRISSSSSWQAEAWEYYDAIGEIKYAFNLVASVVSRIRLYASVVQDPAEAPIPIRNADTIDPRLASAAERALTRLDSAYGGQAGLLRDAALNLCVAGECYLIQVPERIGTGIPESWDIRSVDELQINAKGSFVVNPRREYSAGSGQKNGSIPLPPNAFIGRIWKSHPRYSEEADSSLRGLLDLCAELLLLNRTFRATARSRLNAGALYLPDGLSVAASPDPDYPYGDDADLTDQGVTPEESADEFEDQLIDAMTTPIRDEESASAVVPLVIRGPAELGDKIKQFKFERSFDPALAQRADRVLERILQGLDVPKDVVTGLANVKYSNALQIDEALYKAHIEPLLLLICDSITVVYLRPYLLANGFNPVDVERITIWFDASQVATRNDRAADADSGFDRMAVSFDSWRRAHGFSEADAPTPTELALRLLIEKGAISPDLTESMLGAVAPDVMQATRMAQQAASVAPISPEMERLLKGPSADTTETPDATSTPTGPTGPAEEAPTTTTTAPAEEAPAGTTGPASE